MDMNSLVFAVLLAVVCCSSGEEEGTNPTPIYIATLLPYPDPEAQANFQPSWDEGLNIIPAMELAVRHVQQKEDFLDGYELKLVHEDGGCDISTKTYTGLATLFSAPDDITLVGMIGPGCSASSLVALPLLNRISLIAVHGGESPKINRASFPNSFGTLGSAKGFVEATFALMSKSNWRNLGLLVDPSRPYFSDTVNLLHQDLPSAYPDARILYSSPVYDFFLPVADIAASRVRVIFLFADPELARKVMCIAFHEEMFYPAYQWLIIGHTLEEFISMAITFRYNSVTYNCSTDDLARVLEGNFLVNFKLFPFEENQKTFSGLSYQEYLQQYNASVRAYNSNLENSNNTIDVSIWATYFYDAVWAWAVVLDNVTKSGNFSIEEYQFDQPNNTLIEQFEQVDFEGVSGRIKFDRETGSVDRFIDIYLISNATEEYVAYCNAGAIVKLSTNLQFVPDTFDVVTESVHLAVSITFILLALVQTMVVIATQITVVVNRDFKSIKAVSPRVNHLAYVGIYFLVIGFTLSTSAELFDMKDHSANICQAVWAFFFPYGFTLAFGTAAVRTWRLYRIFNHYLNPGKLISDPALFCIVLLILSFEVVLSIVWTSIDPFFLGEILDSSEIVVRTTCESKYYFLWLGVNTGYHFLILLALLILTLQTRNIQNKSFQTKTLQWLVYCTIAVFGLGASLYYFSVAQRVNKNVNHTLLGATVNSLMLVYLSCVFVPPLVPFIQHKWKESGFIMNLKKRRLLFSQPSQTDTI